MDGCCALCAEPLETGRGLQFEPPCGHRYHFVCVSALLPARVAPGGRAAAAPPAEAGARRLACGTCSELAFAEEDGLALVKRECSREILRAKPSDVEFWLSTELLLGHAVRRLSAVPRAVLYLRGLRCLDFSGHPLPRLPPEISRLSSLKRLVFVSVHISELPEEIGELRVLEQLFATGCLLQHLPGSIGRLQNLWEFYFDGNQLKSLPDPLPPRMDSLKVSGNELTSLPELHQNLRNIRAYGNRLVALPSSICHCDRLCDVLLQGNELRTLPEELGQVRSIRTLLLHDNHLEVLPDSVAGLQDLRWLYLYNNHLKELPKGLLSCMPFLERLLAESNPLTGPAVADLLEDIPRQMRIVGLDASQMESYYVEVSQDGAPEPPPLPSCVSSGWMLPWGRLYGKLTPASQLRRPAGMQPLRGKEPVYGGDVLVVAFAASQGEPEWFGVLGQLLGKEHKRISRERVKDFEELHKEVWGDPPNEDLEEASARAVATMWLGTCNPEGEVTKKPRLECPEVSGAGEGQLLADFDVLSLCETNAQWYTDTPARKLGVEAHLQELAQHYRRVLLIGTSMGGFAALSNAHLAHAVAVFGPQTDLSISHLRPGFSPEDLAAASARMRRNVDRALRAGVRIEYHVATEDHLLYARSLPLPPGGLIIHPIYGRIARVLERGGVLVPALADLIAELQRSSATAPPSKTALTAPLAGGGAEEPLTHYAWDWTSDEHQVLLAKWDTDADSALSFVRASGRQLLLLSRDAPKFGDWFCTHCWRRNEDEAFSCRACGSSCEGAQTVGPPWVARAWWGRGRRQGGGWGPRLCPKCEKEQPAELDACGHCGERLLRHCPNCRSEQESGHKDEVIDVWYCEGCWVKFAAYNESLRREMPPQWFVEGGQRWAWTEGGERRGYIDFSRNGQLDTTWGKGAWKLEGGDMDVTFGRPPVSRRLRRTTEGFRCAPPAAAEGGWPLYGAPAALGWLSLLQLSLSNVAPKLQLVSRARHWFRLSALLLALLSALALGQKARQGRRAAAAAW